MSWLPELAVFPDINNLQTQDELRAWAQDAEYKRDFEGRVPYLGLAAYQCLMMRLGVDTVKPDIWLRRFAEGIVGHRISGAELVRAFTEAAHRVGKSARNWTQRYGNAGRSASSLSVLAVPGIPEMLLAGREREFPGQFAYPAMGATPAAITDADIDEFARTYSHPGGWRGAAGLYQSMLWPGPDIRALAKTPG